MIGMKPAGGIRTAKQAIQYLCVLNETLGADWLTPDLFRFGASSLLNDVLLQLRKQRTGHLPVPRRLHDRLMGAVEKPRSRARRDRRRGSTRPSPEAREIVSFERALRALHRRRAGRAAIAHVVHDDLAVDRGAARRGRAGRARRTSRSRSAPRARRSRTWSALAPVRAGEVPLPDRARPPGARARARRRRVARRRQADQGVARRRPAARRGALLLLRGLGRQARVRVPRPPAAAARRRGADHPVELPAADARLEDRAGARVRQHRRAQARRDDAADRAPLRGRLPPGASCRPASSTSSPATARPARTSSGTTAIDKVAFTGSTEVGKAIQRELAGRDIAADARARRQGGEHRLRRLRARPGGRGDRQRDLLQPGPRVLRGLAAARAGVDPRPARRASSSAGWRRSGSATRSTRTRTSARSTRRRSSSGSRSSSRAATDEGAEIYQPPCRLPEKGYWFAPTVFTNVAQSHRIAQEEIFGPVLSVLTFRTPDEAVEKANNTMYGLSAGVWTEKGSRILWMADRLRAGVVWGEHVQPLRPGRRRSAATRSPASAARAAGTGSSRT